MPLIREHAPPSYQEVSNHGPRVQLPIGELLSLALSGRSVYAVTNPELVYYELSAAPLQATSLTYVVKKVKYRLTGDSRVSRLRTRHDEIYLFRDAYVNFYAPRRIVIDGKSSDARCYKEVKLSPGLMGWSTCSAAGHFTAKTGLSDRWRNHHQVIWKDDSGRIVAMEDKASSPVPGDLAVPCLKLLRMLDEKDLDLLVTCWTARLWKVSQKTLRSPPMGRSRVKRFAARYLRLRYMTDLVSSKSTPTRRLEA
ncbi:hypothetical protein V8C35DRAFT_298526 [Trichoderma chlorosporum]